MARTVRPKPGRGKIEPENAKKKEIVSKVARKKTLSIKPPSVKQLPSKKTIRVRKHIDKEIKYYRGVMTHLVPKATFIRLLKGMVNKIGSDLRFTKDSISMLQDAYESFITATMETAYIATAHAKRITLKGVDLNVAKRIKDRGLF